MQTALERDGRRVVVITQQYQSGLYVATYTANEKWLTTGTPAQGMSTQKEKAYHHSLRAKARVNGDLVEEQCW